MKYYHSCRYIFRNKTSSVHFDRGPDLDLKSGPSHKMKSLCEDLCSPSASCLYCTIYQQTGDALHSAYLKPSHDIENCDLKTMICSMINSQNPKKNYLRNALTEVSVTRWTSWWKWNQRTAGLSQWIRYFVRTSSQQNEPISPAQSRRSLTCRHRRSHAERTVESLEKTHNITLNPMTTEMPSILHQHSRCGKIK